MRVLLIDDEHHFCELVALILGAAGHQLSYRHRANEGIALASEYSFDLILLDIHLPDTDGITACRYFRQLSANKQAALYLISSEKRLGHIENALKTGANGYISKPIQKSSFAQMLEQKFQRQKPSRSPFKVSRLLALFS